MAWGSRRLGAVAASGTLLEALLGRARAEGFGAVSLSVEDGNLAARLYERYGFERRFRGGDAWTMKAELAKGRQPNPRG